jgi:two-component system alkaline phosphatase synthesis response regulator PhoP
MPKVVYKILIVDDSIEIIDFLLYILNKEGYTVEFALNGKEAIRMAESFKPDLILLDVMMPELSGIEVCRELRNREKFKKTQIVFLSARSEENVETEAFDSGCDGFINKPIRPQALLCRIAYLLNPSFVSTTRQTMENIIEIGGVQINKNSYSVLVEGKKVLLPRKAFEILSFLSANPNKFFNRKDILNNIWGKHYNVLPRTVDVHISLIREKIDKDIITTQAGMGYGIKVQQPN